MVRCAQPGMGVYLKKISNKSARKSPELGTNRHLESTGDK